MRLNQCPLLNAVIGVAADVLAFPEYLARKDPNTVVGQERDSNRQGHEEVLQLVPKSYNNPK